MSSNLRVVLRVFSYSSLPMKSDAYIYRYVIGLFFLPTRLLVQRRARHIYSVGTLTSISGSSVVRTSFRLLKHRSRRRLGYVRLRETPSISTGPHGRLCVSAPSPCGSTGRARRIYYKWPHSCTCQRVPLIGRRLVD